jgi:hypothetical protein
MELEVTPEENISENRSFDLEGLSYSYNVSRTIFPCCETEFETGINGTIEYEGKKIGKFYCSIFHVSSAVERGVDIFAIFDCESAAGALAYADLFDLNTQGLKKNVMKNVVRNYDEAIHDNYLDILLIDSIEIKSEFRGYNIGSYVLTRLMWDLASMADVAALQPGLLAHYENGKSKTEIKMALQKLERFYSNLGFHKVRGRKTLYKSLRWTWAEQTPFQDEIEEKLLFG